MEGALWDAGNRSSLEPLIFPVIETQELQNRGRNISLIRRSGVVRFALAGNAGSKERRPDLLISGYIRPVIGEIGERAAAAMIGGKDEQGRIRILRRAL